MATTILATEIADLRQQRRDTRRELARVRWWRRLVRARRDLAVAFIADPIGAGSAGLDLSWEALAAGAPTSSELADAVWPEAEASSVAALESLDDLDTRLAAYEARVVATLDSVTGQMVRAMARAHTVETEEEEA
ncbi:hypothetical protein [Demequina mangrovi]|uniref:Uncharacterized protein n=1 Tax=Demequina mangrovi TaxID=1043493 RepID=A0A1H6VZK2_9MICO|nr:hypothetical protein [Demequina mangrovi]SEJ10069.1 hypothetical protein SAMN05421637_0773 [Demequina mangrovi]